MPLSLTEAAVILKTDRWRLRRLAQDGDVPCIKVIRIEYQFDVDDIKEWFKKNGGRIPDKRTAKEDKEDG